MKVIIFQGGLGNQLFEYAFYQQQLIKSKDKIFYIFIGKGHCGFQLERYFVTHLLKAPFYIRIVYHFLALLSRKIHFSFVINQKQFQNGKKGMFLQGYWQNKRYLTEMNIQFLNMPMSTRNFNVKSKILNTFSVAIHVRRGDYLLHPFCNRYVDLTSLDYYNRAISLCLQRNANCHFFIFSDDIVWCKEHFRLKNTTFVDWNTGDDCIYDMLLMSLTKFNIIANSTFSFWAAKLNTNNLLTIYSKKWYKGESAPDIFDENWIGLD